MDNSVSDKINNTSIKSFKSLYIRTNRIVSAIFLVTNLIDKGSELRLKIEAIGLQILSLSVQFKDKDGVEVAKLKNEVTRLTLELMSFVDVAMVIQAVSQMNGSILKDELSKFLSELSSYTHEVEVESGATLRSTIAKQVSVDIIPQVTLVATTPNLQSQHIKDKDIDKGQTRKETRKGLIYEFILKNGIVNIKDIVPNIKGCSEKTIQREIIQLMNEGKVKREGERRWSRYSAVI